MESALNSVKEWRGSIKQSSHSLCGFRDVRQRRRCIYSNPQLRGKYQEILFTIAQCSPEVDESVTKDAMGVCRLYCSNRHESVCNN